MSIEEVIKIIEENSRVECITDFIICPIIQDIWEDEPVFSTNYEMLERIFDKLEIEYDYDKQKDFIKNNKWVCAIGVEFKNEDFEDIRIFDFYSDTIDNLAERILKEF